MPARSSGVIQSCGAPSSDSLSMSRVACVVLSLFILVVSPAAIKAASDWSPLLEAAFHGDLAQLETLLDGGAEVDATDGEGSTSLMVAASRGHSAIVRELLSRGRASMPATNMAGHP
ncbi:ankyrin repeat domain-containing protein [Marinobacterium aestuariivivens]|uniref:Ankyrin repeat domain-containing protein n=1 Tax=Marinobacterium aestuariivivens TaxID=1698799 RepID=A0ABW1ZY42_9GAMM